jgi:hypothetical protein
MNLRQSKNAFNMQVLMLNQAASCMPLVIQVKYMRSVVCRFSHHIISLHDFVLDTDGQSGADLLLVILTYMSHVPGHLQSACPASD